MTLSDFLQQNFYGNTIETWALALIIVFCSILLGKILYWVFGNVIKKLVSKTKTKLDDIIVDMIEEPIVFAIALIGIWFAIRSLSLTDTLDKWLWNVFQVLIVINVAWLITRLFDSLFKEFIVPLADKTNTDLDDQLFPFIKKGVKIIVWTLAIILALNNAGYDVTALIAGLGIGGIALAMAAKDTVANIFGGITIFMDKPFKIGDRIVIEGFDGTVKEIGLRSSRMETLDGRIVTMPNSKFAETPVENVSLEPGRKIRLNLGLTYDTTPKQMDKAMSILKEIAEKNKHVKGDATISFNAFSDSALNIIFIYYIRKSSNVLKTQSDINMEILKQFNKNKLDFAFPSQTIYNKKG
tara:strand:- start:1463 stop:2524 length:1062 start_codon:yes stop_codon:yes gene_type:complete